MKIRRVFRGIIAGLLVATECICAYQRIPVPEGLHFLTIAAVMFYFKKEEEV